MTAAAWITVRSVCPSAQQPLQEYGEGGAVGDVAGGDGDLGARLGQLGDQFGRAGRLGAAPADQHDPLGALGGQPAGHVRAEGAGAAGDEDGAGRSAG
jgi:hypothetical protein